MKHRDGARLNECGRCGKGDMAGGRFVFCSDCAAVPSATVRTDELVASTLVASASKHLICVLCGRDTSRKEAVITCSTCASTHPDNSHIWVGDTIQDGTSLQHCISCYSLRVRRGPRSKAEYEQATQVLADYGLVLRVPRVITYSYFSPGSREPTNEPPVCHRDLELTINREIACEHDWLALHSTVRHPADARKLRRKLAANPSFVRNMISNDPDEAYDIIDDMAQGAVAFWCARCGSHHRMTPMKLHLLPIRGRLDGRTQF